MANNRCLIRWQRGRIKGVFVRSMPSWVEAWCLLLIDLLQDFREEFDEFSRNMSGVENFGKIRLIPIKVWPIQMSSCRYSAVLSMSYHLKLQVMIIDALLKEAHGWCKHILCGFLGLVRTWGCCCWTQWVVKFSAQYEFLRVRIHVLKFFKVFKSREIKRFKEPSR